MTSKWIIQDLENHLSRRNRVVLYDPNEKCNFLLPIIEHNKYIVLKTDPTKKDEWERVQEELMLRYEAESKHKDENVVFYITRHKSEMSFLFDYCFTHGCVDVSNPSEWLRKKIFTSTNEQITMDDPDLLTVAKIGKDKNIEWWKKILGGLEDLVSLDSELLPFLNNPQVYFKEKDSDIKRLFEDKVFELIGQPYRIIKSKSLAQEVVRFMFNGLINNDISSDLLKIYYKWLDSNTYVESLKSYISDFKIDSNINIWSVHPEHCFLVIDKMQVQDIAANYRDKPYVNKKIEKLSSRIDSQKAKMFVPDWWQDVAILSKFENKELLNCNSFEKVIASYTTSFHKIDRAIRNIYSEFLANKEIVAPLQEHYENLNSEFLQYWFEYKEQYKSNQQGFLPLLISNSQPGTAIIVGDGIRYEMAVHIASQLKDKCDVDLNVMLADMPSETEHNMSALYVGNNEVLSLHKDREKHLSKITGKEITFLNLESLHYGVKGDYLVLTYKDIDSIGETLQMGSIRLFGGFENELVEKIQLLLNIGYNSIHLVTDHGFVLTGLLNESDKVSTTLGGEKEVNERYVRTVDKQTNDNWIEFIAPYGKYKYVYAPKTHRPFRSKGVYGFSHGGFTPQEIIIPNFIFSKQTKAISGLDVTIINMKDLKEVTGEIFNIRLQGENPSGELFSATRKVKILLYANDNKYSDSNIIKLEAGKIASLEFSFDGNQVVDAVVIDADTQEQLERVVIKKSFARDLGGLL